MRRLWPLTILCSSAVVALNVTFSNCLDRSIVFPRFTPTTVSAVYDADTKSISYQIYGNMTGQINDTNEANTLASAVTNTISVAGYTQSKTDKRLCDLTRNPIFPTNETYCPFGPGPALFEFETALNASYIFSSITSQIRINGPTATNYTVGCIELTLTPPFSNRLNSILTYIPLSIMLLVGLKVIVVALANPWAGTADPYRAFSYFGLDPNAIRMATPGFADCLMYVQFAAFSSMLRLNYPGFFQMATSRIAWALLLFDGSPISKALNYTPQSSSSIATYINFVGASRQDAWKSFMIWWIILQACTIGLVTIIVSVWWCLTPSSTGLTRKNFPFLGGCIIRIYYWFLAPMSILTSYQLVTAQQSLASLTAVSALVLMVLVLLLPLALLYHLARYKPRQDLYDDLSILNLFGPLYNTFSTHATLILVPNVILAILRGFVVGFLQDYGTAQIVLFAIFELTSLTIVMFMRPWPQSTNSNLFSILLSAIRFVIIILMIPFLVSLDIGSGMREKIGYVILIIHAAVLVFGFLGNALLSYLELAIRLLVIVPQDEGARAIFGARQLKSRRRKDLAQRDAGIPGTQTSSSSLTALIDSKEQSPFFRTPRNPSRLSSRVGAESSVGEFGSITGSGEVASPYHDTVYYSGSDGKNTKIPMTSSHSYTSEELLETMSRPGLSSPTPTRVDSAYDMTDLSLAPTEDAARRGVDYAVREADVYHPQSSGELLGPSKKLGTGPADPNGIKFRKISWAPPWRKQANEEKGKFVVVRSTPAPQRPTNVPMQELASPIMRSESHSNPLSSHHETVEEEEEAGEADLADSPFRYPDDSAPAIRRVVNDSPPSLPRLTIPTTEDPFAEFTSESFSPTENHAFLGSPIGAINLANSGRSQHQRRPLSQDSQLSELSILARPSRPTTGDRVESYHSATTERSVRSTLVRDSYVESSPNVRAVSAELINFDRLSHDAE